MRIRRTFAFYSLNKLSSTRERLSRGFAIITASQGRYRLGVRTEDSQSSNPGSIPGSATKPLFGRRFPLTHRRSYWFWRFDKRHLQTVPHAGKRPAANAGSAPAIAQSPFYAFTGDAYSRQELSYCLQDSLRPTKNASPATQTSVCKERCRGCRAIAVFNFHPVVDEVSSLLSVRDTQRV